MKPDTNDAPEGRDRARDRLVFAALAVVALVPRLNGLSEWWLNPDEGIYYSILTRADFVGFWSEVTANAHPPLYYLLLRGLGVLTWDFFWFRFFSVFCGVLAVLLTAAVARELSGKGTHGAVAAAVSGLLLAFAPGAVELSQVMRPYMLQLALLSGATLALVRYRREPANGHLVVYALATSAALLTHYSSGLAVAGLGLLVVGLGLPDRWRGREWQRLFWVHLWPGFVVVALYLVHIRPLAGSALADDALQGWLSFYMVNRPADAWLGFLGFQHLMVGPWLRGPLAILTLVGLGLAWKHSRTTALLGTLCLFVGITGAALGLYPFGSTRHSVWLAFALVPVLGWMAGRLTEVEPIGRRLGAAAVAFLLLVVGGPAGRLIGAEAAPWAPPDQVLAQADLTRMVGVLDPQEGPELIVMSAQTFYLLLPFFPAEREAAAFSDDGDLFHFPYGNRHILSSTAWDFTAEVGDPGPAHIDRVLREADRAFPTLSIEAQDPATLLVGGWRPAFIDQLTEQTERHPFVRSSVFVPGLFAYVVSVEELLLSFSGSSAEP